MAKAKPTTEPEAPAAPATTSGQDFVAALQAQQTPAVEPVVAPVAEPPPTQQTIPAPIGEAASPPAASPGTESVPVTPPGFVDQLKELGFQDLADDQQARDRVVAAYRQQQEEAASLRQEMDALRQMAALGQQYVHHLEDPAYQNFVSQRQTPKAEPEPTSEHPWWNPPQFNVEVAQRYRIQKLDANNQPFVDWRDNTPQEIKDQYVKHQNYVEDFADSLVRRPHEVLPQIIQHEAERIVARMIDERFGEQQHQTELERLTSEIKQQNSWMYQVDPRTNQPTEQYSPWGEFALSKIKEAQDGGLNDPRMQWEYACNATAVQYMLQQQGQVPAVQQQAVQQPVAAPVAAAAKTPAERTVEYLKRQSRAASSQPGRNGSAQVPDPEQNGQRPGRRRSPGHDFLEELARSGVAVS